MKDVFVKTKNVKNFLNALSALSQRGSREACLMVVDGKPGLGKTRALNWWACRNDCLCIRAKKEWKPNWFMRDLINAMKKTPEHSFEGMFRQALTELGERSKEAARDGQVFAVVIDEVDYISRSQNLLHHRLTGVYIECLPYQDFITRYDRPNTLFYLDPPYWSCENDYGKGIFSKADFDELAKLLNGIKGKFIMSINDVPEIRRIFKMFYIKEVQTKYSIATKEAGKSKQAAELLVSNINLNTL